MRFRLGLILGIFATLSIAGMHLYDQGLRADDQRPDPAMLHLLRCLEWIGIVLSALSLALLAGRDRRRLVAALPALAVLASCLVPLYLKRIPAIAQADLERLRDEALPRIEQAAGRAFIRVPEIAIGIAGAPDDEFDERLVDTSGTAFRIARYDPDTGTVRVDLAELGRMHRDREYDHGETRDMARLALLLELVHALDDQHGLRMREAERARVRARDPYMLFIRRTLEESRSEEVALAVARRLGVLDPRGLCHAYGWRRYIASADDVRRQRLDPIVLVGCGEGATRIPSFADWRAFVEAVYRSGGAAAVAAAFDLPALWTEYVLKPELFLRDRETGLLERQTRAMEDLRAVLERHALRPAHGDSFGLWPPYSRDRGDPDPLPLGGTPSPVRDRLLMTLFGGYTKSAGTSGITLRLFRFTDPEAAKGCVDAARAYLEDDRRLSSFGYALCTTSLLGDDGVLCERSRMDDSREYDFFASRGDFTLHLQAKRGVPLDDLRKLWKDIVREFLGSLDGR